MIQPLDPRTPPPPGSADVVVQDGAASLARLHDIVVPSAPPWWPPAPGWFVLGAFIAIVAICALVVGLRRHRALAWRRAALAELTLLRRSRTATRGHEAAALLRRAAIAAHGRRTVASLTGTAWTTWLDRHGATPDAFRSGDGRTLATAAYDSHDALSDEAHELLLDAIEAWIRAQSVATPNVRERADGESAPRSSSRIVPGATP